MARVRLRVTEDDAGARLDRIVAAHPAVGSRSEAERLIASGAATVDGAARPKSHRVEAGSIVVVDVPETESLEPRDLGLSVVYADEHLLVVDKPAGLVVHPAGRSRGDDTLLVGLLALGAAGGEPGRAGIVHRLDRDTSGLMLVSRSEEARRRLQASIRRRDVDRRYLALVRGRPRSRTGRIDAPIGRDRRDRTRQSLDTEKPRSAVTWFEVQELLDGRALLEVRLETGRTHQIRVHLSAIELPVSGDPTYGVAGDLGLDRQFLHAHRLRFPHPLTGEEIDVSAPLPEDLARALERARSEAGTITTS